MKRSLLILLEALIFPFVKMFAQCYVVPLHNEMEWQMQTFNNKDKQRGTIAYKVTSITTEGEFTVTTVYMGMIGEKGKVLSNGDYTFKCKVDGY